jgi:predicted GNAT family acetyltransferase
LTTTVRDNTDQHRYELVIGDDIIGFADYSVHGDTVVLPHTVIDPAHRGKGFGAVLVRGALDDIRDRGLAVDPRCWYVAEFIRAHDEYAELTRR